MQESRVWLCCPAHWIHLFQHLDSSIALAANCGFIEEKSSCLGLSALPLMTMASVQQGEKQLFEKFWKGTFKAVATPRRESIIVASITARKPLPSYDSITSSASPLKEEKYDLQNGSLTHWSPAERLGRDLSIYHPYSPAGADRSPSPPQKSKKKKKKSERKKRKRSRSYSPSPVKKKKKKSSKKKKRNRSSPKKKRHSSSSPKSKRKQDKKHRKHSHGRQRKSHHHHHHRSRSASFESISSSYENRLRDQSKEERHRSKRKRHKCRDSRSVNKKQRESKLQCSILPAPNGCSTKIIHKRRSDYEIPQSVPGLLVTAESNGSLRKDNTNEYDSGNDTCSPPSTQASSSRLKVNQEKDSPNHQEFGQVPSSGKTPNGHSDNISDSGNSSASCFSFTKDGTLLLADSRTQDKRSISSCLGCLEEQKSLSDLSPDRNSTRSRRSRSSTYTDTQRSCSHSSSHSISSNSSHYRSSGRKSRCRSSSSEARSYSRSPSYSSKSDGRSPASRSSRTRRSPSYSRYSPSRDRDHGSKYSSSEKETRKRTHRRRRSYYSPLRKRRRDSPSHLEARRITSARKRPIPYYRPSPSSASSASSTPSFYGSHSWSRSRSYSSDRSSRSRSTRSGRSRSREWSRSSRERSRSRSWSQSSDSCNSTRR
ncbi:Hypothetical predicted protein [Pelobates cultripes]|uniref:Serine/arginine repetitive matrix protein C-terminal domain-containing protein n=1 Tax=Pelobates cultripes TaxID=61616 RepID=A0AAD1SCE9_PELCU|nr:Hypothetical predicted protein [Pelobates cultripes]